MNIESEQVLVNRRNYIALVAILIICALHVYSVTCMHARTRVNSAIRGAVT